MPMDMKKPVGNGVSVPQYKTGTTTIIPNVSMKVSISDGKGMTDTGPNKSAKFKNPNVKQDISELDRAYLNNS